MPISEESMQFVLLTFFTSRQLVSQPCFIFWSAIL